MAYDTRTYRILIASPSDVEEERDDAVRVIHQWNDLNSYSRGVVLLPLRWETHTAPEYGTRPQEVINRLIVDDCDLLVGIFWTRIGSATGLAESGTIEEIERVGKAGKPIMLYFSKVPISPDKIDNDQIEKLRHFEKNTYPQALIETYDTTRKFRDRFAGHLEMKVRELQESDKSRKVPVSLEFVSIDGFKGNERKVTCDHLNVVSFEEVPQDKREAIEVIASSVIRGKSQIPVALAINNSSSSSIRSLYVELRFRPSSKKMIMNESSFSPHNRFDYGIVGTVTKFFSFYEEPAESDKSVQQIIAKFDPDRLQTADQGWMMTFEWDALQPLRTRLIKPIVFVYSPEPAILTIEAKLFTDSFPNPIVLEAKLIVEAKQKPIPLVELLPDWDKPEQPSTGFSQIIGSAGGTQSR
jgi:hypothetical protein